MKELRLKIAILKNEKIGRVHEKIKPKVEVNFDDVLDILKSNIPNTWDDKVIENLIKMGK